LSSGARAIRAAHTYAKRAPARAILVRGFALRRHTAAEVLDFERDPALDTAALPTSPPGRHFTLANLT
jgi:hypothetical protein